MKDDSLALLHERAFPIIDGWRSNRCALCRQTVANMVDLYALEGHADACEYVEAVRERMGPFER